LSDYRRNIIFVTIFIVSAVILVLLSNNFFTQTANQIYNQAINDLKTNAEIEAFSISNALYNAIYSIISNLVIVAESPAAVEWNTTRLHSLIDIAQSVSNNLTDGYYLLDSNGRLVTFSGADEEQFKRFIGVDLSYRDYFQVPKYNGTSYISPVIVSNDNKSRMYISVPIIQSNKSSLQGLENEEQAEEPSTVSSNSTIGVVVASIESKVLGSFLQSQMHPKIPGTFGFIDRDNTILYTNNATFIGKNYFGNEFQSHLKSILKNQEEGFNTMVEEALVSENGIADFKFENASVSIAYRAILGPTVGDENNLGINRTSDISRAGTLFLVVPHTLAQEVNIQSDSQKLINFIIIGAIASVSGLVAVVLLKWNKILNQKVRQKTAELKKANDDLIEKDKLQREFINVAAHELRTPTQALTGYTEFDDELYNELSKVRKDIDKQELERILDTLHSHHQGISRNATRLENLINNLLDVARIDSGKKDMIMLHEENFDLTKEIKDIIAVQLSPKLKDKNIKVNFVNDVLDEPCFVYADQSRVNQVLTNLLDNAIKFSKKNGSVDIMIRDKIFDTNNEPDLVGDNKSKLNKEQVFVAISDTGKGISSNISPKLFEKFNTDSDVGTGLGLYISKKLVEAMGGKIWAFNNNDGIGSTFVFSLPKSKGNQQKPLNNEEKSL
jgi:signal transduction histidine kinase